MYTYRNAKPEEIEACIELANYVFSTAHRPHDFETLIPKVYGSDKNNAPLHRVAVDENGRLRAELAVLPEELHMLDKTLNIGFIGTVCVHPKERGTGHMKKLMHDTLEECSKLYDMVVLGGQRQRYEHFGFTQGGMECFYEVDTTNIRHRKDDLDLESFSFVPVSKETPMINETDFVSFANGLNTSRKLYVTREKQNLLDILTTYYGSVLAVLKQEQLFGYLVLESDSVVSEIALLDESMTSSVISSYMLQHNITELSIHLPFHQVLACDSMASLAESTRIQSAGGCMFYVFNFKRLLSAAFALKTELGMLTPGSYSLWIEDQPFTISYDGSDLSISEAASEDAPRFTRMEAQAKFLSIGQRNNWTTLPLFWYRADEF